MAKEFRRIEDPHERAEVAQLRMKEYEAGICNPANAVDNGSVDMIIEPASTRVRVIEALKNIVDRQPDTLWKKRGCPSRCPRVSIRSPFSLPYDCLVSFFLNQPDCTLKILYLFPKQLA